MRAAAMLEVVREGLFPAVVFAGDPEDVVAIKDAPDGDEGIAEAEVFVPNAEA